MAKSPARALQLEDQKAQAARLRREVSDRDERLATLQHRLDDLASRTQQDKDSWEELAAQQQQVLSQMKAERDTAVGSARDLQATVRHTASQGARPEPYITCSYARNLLGD